ncbi:DeoR/GlpR family DNA-binding transcription regulator [Acetobacteraceae bacterium KSS8]|uniref:DeoR/GlpR family DNA-binding transcription regulator n=1 Tax=Endosaccharibacter trunci TaxID=2812733 RepID=A0ABT1W5V4_9PROT|nr:DeoR/GlpR family DNA-binding transcription regulator [Acetobacteraceae bacterium KSS8]
MMVRHVMNDYLPPLDDSGPQQALRPDGAEDGAQANATADRPLSRRQQDIASLLRGSGRLSVEELASRFTVTPQTIRRDLNELADAGVITRVHGGAIIASGIANLSYDARKQVASEAKRRIGEAAAALIPESASIFINLGTTTEEVARAIAGRSGLMVVTNNMNVALKLYRNPGIQVIVAGGSLRASDGGIVGRLSADAFRQFKADVAVIGTSAIDGDGALLDYDLREVQVSRAIIDNARRVMLVTDSSKFTRAAPVRIARLEEIDMLVTDRLTDPALRALCREAGVEVIETDAEADSSLTQG